MKTKASVIPRQPVEHLIRTIRGQRIILDTDLAQDWTACCATSGWSVAGT